MAFQRGVDGPDPSRRLDPVAGLVREQAARAAQLGTGTLACPRCDAPVVLGVRPAAPGDALACPFCDHDAPLRDFLSLSGVPRPTRVEVRLVRRAGR